jgi:hypothetical protein
LAGAFALAKWQLFSRRQNGFEAELCRIRIADPHFKKPPDKYRPFGDLRVEPARVCRLGARIACSSLDRLSFFMVVLGAAGADWKTWKRVGLQSI